MPFLLKVICLFFLFPVVIQAETRFVTDEFEVTLRTGPSGEHTIQRMLKSGTKLEELGRDIENGYSMVRTGSGTEGWVLSRYLIKEQIARKQLEKLTSELINSSTHGQNVRSQVAAIKKELDQAAENIAALEVEREKLQDELEKIKNVAANTLAIDNLNEELRQRLEHVESQKNTLMQENQILNSNKEKEWFIAGALVLLSGMLISLIFSRIQWRKRSRYETF